MDLIDFHAPRKPAALFVLEAATLRLKGYLTRQDRQSDSALRDALASNDIKIERPIFDVLRIGEAHFQFHPPLNSR
jgi:hypothetical protein